MESYIWVAVGGALRPTGVLSCPAGRSVDRRDISRVGTLISNVTGSFIIGFSPPSTVRTGECRSRPSAAPIVMIALRRLYDFSFVRFADRSISPDRCEWILCRRKSGLSVSFA